MNVVDYFFENALNFQKDFVVGSKETISYRELIRQSLMLSAVISEKIGQNNKVLLISENSVFFIIVYLAVMKSGNICVPLNPATESENFNYIIKETEGINIFISRKYRARFSKKEINVWDEDFVRSLTAGDYSLYGLLGEEFDENRVAQILFTSGSTGKPKGVVLSHKNLIANTNSIIKYLGLTSGDRIEIVLPFYYCYGLSLLHTHLRVGGSVVLNNYFIFLGSVIDDLKKYHCTGFAGVPSHFQILLRKSKSFAHTDFPDLRYLTQAGGKLYDAFIREFAQTFPDKKFYVMYGQTEATARLSYLPPELLTEKMGSIGKGIPGVTLDVFDADDRPVKPGEVGEIVARGDNIMIGYLNDPKGSRETLRNGWLHTGDLAKKDRDGFIFLVARKKEIIKVGGKRISPKEIEEVIVAVPAVVDCLVEGIYDEVLGEAIKARVVLKSGITEEEAKDAIIKMCKKHLAQFKIPQLFEFKSKMDINEAGKKVSRPPIE